jgi:hypothetical protein
MFPAAPRMLPAVLFSASVAGASVAGAHPTDVRAAPPPSDAAPVEAPSTVEAYAPEWFADAAPSNAHDMVLRLPAFVVVDPDPGVRGYAGAQGNVLIDGARPPSKRERLADVLRRIPAGAVERIELIRGGAGGADPGRDALVANVVLRRVDATRTALEASLAASSDGWLRPGGRYETTRRRGERETQWSLVAQPALDDDSGRGRVREFTPAGVPTDERDRDARHTVDLATAGAGWRGPGGGGHWQADLALRSTRDRFDETVSPGEPREPPDTVREDEDRREAELDARYTRETSGGATWEFIASQQAAWVDADESARDEEGEERFVERTDLGESIARVEFTQQRSARLTLLAGLEGAWNRLDSDAQLSEDGEPVEVPGSDVRIRERRAEGYAGVSWEPSQAWNVDANMRLEYSGIHQTGDSPLERDYTYPKPRVSTTWQASDADRVRLSLAREVGQLDFEDFVASAALDTGVVSAGNADLRPHRTWRTLARWDRDLGGDAALALSWTHDEISDVVDRVPVVADGEVFDAPGNIGDGTRDTLALESSAGLGRVGLAGWRVAVAVIGRHSEVVDPTTGERRGISEEAPLEGEIELTRTRASDPWSWGAELQLAERETSYLFDEIATERAALSWSVFVERRFARGWRLRLDVTDAFGRDLSEDRLEFAGPRDTFPADQRELREHEMPGVALLTLRRDPD